MIKRWTYAVAVVAASAILAACSSATTTTTSEPTTTSATSAPVATSEATADTAMTTPEATSSEGATPAATVASESATAEATSEAAAEATAPAAGRATTAPAEATALPAPTAAESAPIATVGTSADQIIAALEQQGNLSVLVAALQATGLDQQLAQAGEVTIFAPTDTAFASLPSGTVQALLADPAQLQKILTYHVVEQQLSASDLSSQTSVTTMEGQPITVASSGTGVTLNGTTNVTSSDITAGSVVIHVIDAVLLPPDVTLPAN